MTIDLKGNNLDFDKINDYEIYLLKPVSISDESLSNIEPYLGSDGEIYVPFDGEKDLYTFSDENGDVYYCSMDGDNFYNANGQKLIGFFKKVGGGVVKTGKFLGKNIAKASRWIAKKSKNVAKGVKNLGKNIKTKGKKLIHLKKKTSTKGKSSGNSNNKSEDSTQNQEDVFTKPLEKATQNTPLEKIVEVEGEKFSTEGVDNKNQITVSKDPESGEKVVGVDYKPSDVVAVSNNDGYIDYYDKKDVGMDKNLKIGLIIGGCVIATILLSVIVYKSINKNK